MTEKRQLIFSQLSGMQSAYKGRQIEFTFIERILKKAQKL